MAERQVDDGEGHEEPRQNAESAAGFAQQVWRERGAASVSGGAGAAARCAQRLDEVQRAQRCPLSVNVLRRSRAVPSKVQTLSDVAGRCRSVQASPCEPDIAVGTQQVESGPGDVCARELLVVGRIARNVEDA